MSLTTFSKFYFGHTVTNLNGSIDFDEGAGELQATLNPGDYSLEEYVSEIKRAMDDVGGQAYSVSLDRTTRFITIAATSNFTLRALTGTRIGTGAWSMMGFTTVANFTGTNTYTGTLGSGSEYLAQSLLVDHVDAEDFVEKTDATVNESASGRVQVVTFGTTSFIQFTMRFATNKVINPCQTSIETQTNGVANLRTFMNYIVTKAKFEFIPNRAVATSFYKVILESTEKSRQGTAFQLEELKDAPGYFSSGKLVLRVVT